MNKKFKSKALLATLISSLVSLPVAAEVVNPAKVESPAVKVNFDNSLNNVDLSYAFGGSQDLYVVAMTQQEMDETQGAWVVNAIGAVAGAGVGAWGYFGKVTTSHQFDWGDFAFAVGGGAISGAIAPASIGQYYALSRVGFVLGALNGLRK